MLQQGRGGNGHDMQEAQSPLDRNPVLRFNCKQQGFDYKKWLFSSGAWAAFSQRLLGPADFLLFDTRPLTLAVDDDFLPCVFATWMGSANVSKSKLLEVGKHLGNRKHWPPHGFSSSSALGSGKGSASKAEGLACDGNFKTAFGVGGSHMESAW
jgi:hypothetical protein